MPDAFVPLEILDLYRSLSSGRVAVNPTVYVGEWHDVADHLLYQHNLYRRWAGREPARSVEELPRSHYLIGTPDEVADDLQAVIDRTRCDRLYFWGRLPGLEIELANASLERFAREVLPRLRPSAAG
jgi:alkanesulfonate monooxygenase SsuD/methylene tetrahydromethanopterin reductase-like flavin-dependent oxidoreductase (luciferase family)